MGIRPGKRVRLLLVRLTEQSVYPHAAAAPHGDRLSRKRSPAKAALRVARCEKCPYKCGKTSLVRPLLSCFRTALGAFRKGAPLGRNRADLGSAMFRDWRARRRSHEGASPLKLPARCGRYRYRISDSHGRGRSTSPMGTARRISRTGRPEQGKGRWSRASIDPCSSLVSILTAASIPRPVNESA